MMYIKFCCFFLYLQSKKLTKTENFYINNDLKVYRNGQLYNKYYIKNCLF